MKLLLAAFAAVVAFAMPALADPTISPVGRLADSDIKAFSPIDETGFCTVFYIGDQRFISAGHCASDGKGAKKIILQNGNQVPVEVIAFANPSQGMADFSVLEAGDPRFTANIKPAKLECGYKPVIGYTVRAEGFPQDMGFTTTWGRISRAAAPWAADHGGWTKPVFGVNISISNGDSGGPLFDDATGEVIGILVGALPKNQTLVVAQPIGPVCALLGLK